MTVYVVTEGAYSDYSIVAIFSTREAADAYVTECRTMDPANTYAPPTVEEYEMDTPREELPGAYQVVIGIKGGVHSSRWSDYVTASTPARWTRDRPSFRNHNPPLTFTGYGLTEEHARRSAEELRRAVVAGTVILPDEATAKYVDKWPEYAATPFIPVEPTKGESAESQPPATDAYL